MRLRGLYAPITREGTMVVNGVWVSCYSILSHHDMSHYLYRFYTTVYDFLPSFLQKFWSEGFAGRNLYGHILNLTKKVFFSTMNVQSMIDKMEHPFKLNEDQSMNMGFVGNVTSNSIYDKYKQFKEDQKDGKPGNPIDSGMNSRRTNLDYSDSKTDPKTHDSSFPFEPIEIDKVRDDIDYQEVDL